MSFNLYDAFVDNYGNDYESIKFIVHNHKLYIGIKYDGNYKNIERFKKAFTDPSIKIPNDISIYKYIIKHKTKNKVFHHATPGKCSEVLTGDYIFRSNNDFHFFAKEEEEVEANDNKYIEIDPIFAGNILLQNSYPSFTKYYIDKILKEKITISKNGNDINGIVLKFDGTKESANDIDNTLVRLQEMNNLIHTLEDENISYSKNGSVDEYSYTLYNYATFRFMYDDKNNKAFLVQYNFIDIDNVPWEMYCDFSDIEVHYVEEGNCIIFDSTHSIYDNDNSCIIRIVKDKKNTLRIMDHIFSKIN